MPKKPLQNTDELVVLLDEYLIARERDREVDIAEYEARAGERAGEFRRFASIATRIEGLSQFIEKDSPSEEEPIRFGRFETIELLGVGGHSRVYLAHDPKLGREIALKVMGSGALDATEDSLAEARALARFDHDSVVKVFEIGEHEKCWYIAMERVVGEDLRSIIRSLQAAEDPNAAPSTSACGPVDALRPTAARCRLMARIARALAYCHREGVVHRDIKPENVLVEGGLAPKLIDFGLARLEDGDATNVTQGLRGTPAYFAPEQVDRGIGGASATSDQFAFGVLLYEFLTLEHPFRAETLNATMSAISAAQPLPLRRRRPGLPPDLELICTRCLEREPNRRYASMTEVAEDLEAFLDHRAIRVRPATPARQLVLWVARHRRLAAAVAAMIAGALIWTLFSTGRSIRAHAGFMESVVEHRARLPALTDGVGFKEQFQWILDSRAAARARDDSLVGGLRRKKCVAALDELWHRSFERLDEELRFDGRTIVSLKNENAFYEFLESWDGVTYLAGSAAPNGAPPVRLRAEACVALPAEGALYWYRTKALPIHPVLEPVANLSGKLQKGQYRYQLEKSGVCYETEFVHRPEEPRWAPPLHELDPVLERMMVDVIGGELLEPVVDVECRYDPFRCVSEPVTWKKLREKFSDDELKPLIDDSDNDRTRGTLPAIVPWVFAQEYAVRVGARLPTIVELVAIEKAEMCKASLHVHHEWTSALFPSDLGTRFFYVYQDSERARQTALADRVEGRHCEATVELVGFRVVRSLGTRQD